MEARMIDALLLPLQRHLMVRPARWLADRGVQADHITLAGFLIGIGGVSALAGRHYLLALTLILLNRLFDALDGAVARATRPTDRGAFLDIALDFMLYALVPVGFALADPASNALPAVVLLASFVGTGSSFLAFAAIAAKRGMAPPAHSTKGIYFLGGLTEGFETIVFFIAIHLFPAAFPMLAYGFAAACAITTLTRWHQGWRAFANRDAKDPGAASAG
jgi:phosphatidylglycerophosphate synthase